MHFVARNFITYVRIFLMRSVSPELNSSETFQRSTLIKVMNSGSCISENILEEIWECPRWWFRCCAMGCELSCSNINWSLITVSNSILLQAISFYYLIPIKFIYMSFRQQADVFQSSPARNEPWWQNPILKQNKHHYPSKRQIFITPAICIM